MIRSLYYLPGQPTQKDLHPERFRELIQNPKAVLWVDFISEPPETCQPILEEFGFHPLAIDDALQETHVPRLDDWGEYLYIVFNYMDMDLNGQGWETEVDELDVFLGKNYIVTHHDHRISAVPRLVCVPRPHLPQRIRDGRSAGRAPAEKSPDSA